MGSLFLGTTAIPKYHPLFMIRPLPLPSFSVCFRTLGPPKRPLHFPRPLTCCNAESSEEDHQTLVQNLRVPDHWLIPSNALQESEWLRVTLHKWLDDEYCPEATNIEISKLAARSYYESLIGKQSDLGEILLKMIRDLESLSYQESFHGAFSSANAAVDLISLRMESYGEK
ncbi:plant/protein [Tasmannia lanceolata]|uniref:plant/protein n=1 Tax=Tasmannia lanceolata TaxID=3420 RepID=UPI00406403FB